MSDERNAAALHGASTGAEHDAATQDGAALSSFDKHSNDYFRNIQELEIRLMSKFELEGFDKDVEHDFAIQLFTFNI